MFSMIAFIACSCLLFVLQWMQVMFFMVKDLQCYCFLCVDLFGFFLLNCYFESKKRMIYTLNMRKTM